MAKAHITTQSGTKVTIEGTPDEVATLVAKMEGKVSARPKRGQQSNQHKGKGRPGPVSLVSELIDGGFFKKPKELSAIKLALQEQGHHYPVTTLSGIMLRFVRNRQLRRIKDKKRWLYVG